MELNPLKKREIDETVEFKIFSQDIDYITEFLKDLSELISFSGRILFFHTSQGSYKLDTALIDSSVQTLKSIKLCCSIGSFSDANTLIRKLRDDLVQYNYILSIRNLSKPFTEDSIKNLNTDNPKDFTNSMLNLQFNNKITEDEQVITAWFKNAISDFQKLAKRKLDFNNYMKVLKQNSNINHILTTYNLEGYWETLGNTLNNYVHNNGAQFSNHNFISAKNEQLETHLKEINIRTSYITSFFLVLLLMIESSLISSTDYISHLDCDIAPPEDSQYFVASFIQDFIDKKVTKIHPELKQYLMDNNIHSMKIE